MNDMYADAVQNLVLRASGTPTRCKLMICILDASILPTSISPGVVLLRLSSSNSHC